MSGRYRPGAFAALAYAAHHIGSRKSDGRKDIRRQFYVSSRLTPGLSCIACPGEYGTGWTGSGCPQGGCASPEDQCHSLRRRFRCHRSLERSSSERHKRHPVVSTMPSGTRQRKLPSRCSQSRKKMRQFAGLCRNRPRQGQGGSQGEIAAADESSVEPNDPVRMLNWSV
jgi:hypothetical protein